MPRLLEVENLTVSFPASRYQWRHEPSVSAVDGVSLSVEEGEILGLVGESGAGKSLTGAALMDLVPSPGRTRFDALRFAGERRSLSQLAGLRGREIAMVFQDPLSSLNPLRTIGDVLVETLLMHGDYTRAAARDRGIELLESVGIPAAQTRFHAYPHAFSGGMRQRVVIALALAGNPRLIIADEPTTALDVSIQAQIMGLLKRLSRSQGVSIILVTHDIGLIAETSDRVAVMYAGRLVEIGETQQVLTSPKHPYTSGLLSSTPSVTRKEGLQQIPGAMPRLGAIPEGCAFHPRCRQSSERCTRQRPALQQQTADYAIACHLFAEGASA